MVAHWSGFALAVLLVGNGGGAVAAPAPESAVTHPLTLETAVRLALENHPDLRAASARVEAAAGRAQQARPWPNPELELRAEDWPASPGRGFADAKQLLGLTQTLPFPGKKSLDRQIGGAGVKFSEAELALRRAEIERDVKAAFWRVLVAERLVEVSGQLVAVAESAAATARQRVEAGAAAYPEQLRAEVQAEQARTELAERQRELAGARQLLGTLLGRPDLQAVPLAGTLPDAPDAALPTIGEESWLAGHPSVAAARANLERAKLEERRARLAAYPDVKLGMAGGRLGTTDETLVEVSVSVPLPLLDRGQGRQREARANVRAAEAELRSVRAQLQRELANAQTRLRTAAEQTARYRERILPKAEEALRLVQTGFQTGKFAFVDLLDTQRTVAETRRAYWQTVLEWHLARTELEALTQPAPPSAPPLPAPDSALNSDPSEP